MDKYKIIEHKFSEAMREICNGSRHQNFRFENAKLEVDMIYELEGFKRPVVVVCENPVEMQMIAKALEKVCKDDPEVEKKINSMADLAANSEDSETVELLGKEIHKIGMNRFLADVNAGKFPEYDRLIVNPDSDIFFSGLFSGVYREWFSYLKEETGLDMKDREKLFSVAQRGGVFAMLPYEGIAIISKFPVKIHRNPAGRLHNPLGSAIEFSEIHPLMNRKVYFINGRRISKTEIFEKEFTLDQFLREQDEEIRAAMFANIEAKGNDHLINFLQLDEVDRITIKHEVEKPMFSSIDGSFVGTKNEEEEEEIVLYRTKFDVPGTTDPRTGKTGGKLAFLKFVCPSTGTNYLIYTSPSFDKAIEAVKFSRPFRDLNLDYKWTQRS